MPYRSVDNNDSGKNFKSFRFCFNIFYADAPTFSSSNPFASRVDNEYNKYLSSLKRAEFKNKETGMHQVLSNVQSTVELPSIRNRNLRFA